MAAKKPLVIKSIGVITGLDLVGDALIKLPFARALRAAFPEAKIHWITSKGPTAFNGPLRDVTRELIDVIHERPGWIAEPGSQAPETGTKSSSPNPEPRTPNPVPYFDLLIDTRNRLKDAWRVRQTVPHGLFLSSAARFLVSSRRPSFFKTQPLHIVDRLLQYVELAAGSVPSVTARLPVPEVLLAKARQLLPKGRVYVGFAPGAGNPIKIWPRERFAELAALQAAQGRRPVFLLGPQEQDWLPELKLAVPEALFPLQARKVWGTPDIAIEETLAIGSLLNIAVANDSGTGHMLAAVDCPLISLFGPTSPEKLAPRVTHGTVIRAQDFGDKTIDTIPVETVHTALNSLLKSFLG